MPENAETQVSEVILGLSDMKVDVKKMIVTISTGHGFKLKRRAYMNK